MTKSITVVTHNRASRKDRVGDLLRAAADLRKARTLDDFVTIYSREHDDASLKFDDPSRFLWHLDPVERRSVVAQAQARLRQHCDAIVIIDKITNVPFELERAQIAGEFSGLLGPKLRPSTAVSKPGKKPKWCGNIQPLVNKEVPPDGLSNPMILELRDLAFAAGDVAFATGDAIKEIAKMPKMTRTTVIAEKKRDYNLLLRKNAEANELQGKITRLGNENQRLISENTNLQQQLKALEGLDFVRLARDYGAADAISA